MRVWEGTSCTVSRGSNGHLKPQLCHLTLPLGGVVVELAEVLLLTVSREADCQSLF